jgi:ubiquinone/menaquinone biosynthesis C-methylase UbiE
MSEDSLARQDSYAIDPESSAEMARLIDQHHFLTENMGGLFPPGVNPARFKRVLDLACGPGGWVQDVAYQYPDMQVIGVDIGMSMIDYARAICHVRRLHNAAFDMMDIRKPLSFDDNSFDFVNVRFLVYVLSPADWPGLIAECKRILKPGGILRLTEADGSDMTSSAAYERLLELSMSAARKHGRAFFPYGRFLGTMFVTGHLLQQAGFEHIQRQAHVMDWSANSEAHHAQYANVQTGLVLGKQFVTSSGITTPVEFDELYNQAIMDMQSAGFIASLIYISAWGTKPEQ